MPQAAVRRPARELPLTVELNDSQSMLPSLKLSSVAEVVVNARISHTGTVMPAAGDLEAVAVPLHQDGKPARVELLIRDVRR
jgi:cytochrome c-type biogenesis protein CcmH